MRFNRMRKESGRGSDFGTVTDRACTAVVLSILGLIVAATSLLVSVRSCGIAERSLVEEHRPFVQVSAERSKASNEYFRVAPGENDLQVEFAFLVKNVGSGQAINVSARFTTIAEPYGENQVRSKEYAAPATSLGPQEAQLMLVRVDTDPVPVSLLEALRADPQAVEISLVAEITVSYESELSPETTYSLHAIYRIRRDRVEILSKDYSASSS